MGWRAAARPLLVDYVDRLAQEVGSRASCARQALVQRLPITIRIEGPGELGLTPNCPGPHG